jgi:hypothetical protein
MVWLKANTRPTLVLSLLMTSDLFATMQEKILFHAITSHEQFFSFQQTKAKISYVWFKIDDHYVGF